MKRKRIIGIIDYGMGNHASVLHVLRLKGYRCLVSRDHSDLANSDLLILPGVGAFAEAMAALHRFGLVQLIRDQAYANKPIVGICLGMQLLAESSTETGFTDGLNLIPGKVESLGEGLWNIGWNEIEIINTSKMFKEYDNQTFYFNHSYVFHVSQEYLIAVSNINAQSEPFPVIVHRKNVVGLQFHPEKSQVIGQKLLVNVIEGLCSA